MLGYAGKDAKRAGLRFSARLQSSGPKEYSNVYVAIRILEK